MQREQMTFDVIVVGGGPAGLSAAIHLAQLAKKNEVECSICVLEKAQNIGDHLLSGAVIDPEPLDSLLPGFKEKNEGLFTPVSCDAFKYLTKNHAFNLPVPNSLKNKGNLIVSIGAMCSALAIEAESLGVNIFPGFPAGALLFDADKTRVLGVQTADQGLTAEGEATSSTQLGIALYADQVVFAEGCRGSLSEQVIAHFKLRAPDSPQSYGLGIKEVWKIDPEHHQHGAVTHTVGWPLSNDTYGGGFIYHVNPDQLTIGLVVGLDYKNPYLDPFEELQRLKTHPNIRRLLRGGTCLSYGAKALNEGGYQGIPKLSFPGGLLVGCAAGFLNVAQIKGVHNAISSGMLAAKAISNTLGDKKNRVLVAYQKAIEASSFYKALYIARNIRPSFSKGLWAGLLYSGLDQYLFKGKAPWTFKFKPDHTKLGKKHDFKKINYPPHDKKITFDKLTQVSLSGTDHREGQPCHLFLKSYKQAIDVNLKHFDSPETRYCPAGVYEIIIKNNRPHFQINAANCLHCKTCDIKDPEQNIIWKTPEGGGPRYNAM